MPALPYSIIVSDEDCAYLKSLIKAKTIPSQVVDRARILLWKSEAKTDQSVADGLGVMDELSERIYRYFDKINADPIVYHWMYKIDEIDPDEATTI